MAITLNNFRIINEGTQLEINVTTTGSGTPIIETIHFWKMMDFKNPGLTIDLSSFLLQTSNTENLLINATDIGLVKFEDLCFIEITSSVIDTDPCGNLLSPALGITYDLSAYYGCLLSYLLEIPLDCTTCDNTKINQMVVTINMLLDTIVKTIDIGYYTEAIAMVNNLKKLCSLNKCTNCTPIECPTCNNFIQL